MAEPRVLMVDDNEEFLEATGARLELRDLKVDTATSGEAAVKRTRKWTYDVVVLDLAMPGMDGVEALRLITEQQPFMQVIMLTGQGSYEAALKSGQNHAFKFLEKPIDVEELAAVIRQAHEEKGRLQAEAYRQELGEVLKGFSTPKEIIEQTRKLLEKYEQ